MRRLLTTLALTSFLVLATAAAALADSDVGHDGGEGWMGETNDRIVTNAGFILIGAFPLVIFLASMIQGALDRRKDARKKAAKARAARADVRGGW